MQEPAEKLPPNIESQRQDRVSKARVYVGSIAASRMVRLEGVEPLVAEDGALGFDSQTLIKLVRAAASGNPETVIWIKAPERANGQENNILRLADNRLEHDGEGTVVKVDGIDIALSSKEHEVFSVLAKNYKKTVHRDRMVAEIWEGIVGARAIDVNIYNIRGKLGDLRWVIKTMHGMGYKLDDTPDTRKRNQIQSPE